MLFSCHLTPDRYSHLFSPALMTEEASHVRSCGIGISRPMRLFSSLSPWESMASHLHPASRERTQLSSIFATTSHRWSSRLYHSYPSSALPFIASVLILSSSLHSYNGLYFVCFLKLLLHILWTNDFDFRMKSETSQHLIYDILIVHLFLNLTDLSSLL